jgi:hypothetical protein
MQRPPYHAAVWAGQDIDARAGLQQLGKAEFLPLICGDDGKPENFHILLFNLVIHTLCRQRNPRNWTLVPNECEDLPDSV